MACWVSGQDGQQWPVAGVGGPTHTHIELRSVQPRSPFAEEAAAACVAIG